MITINPIARKLRIEVERDGYKIAFVVVPLTHLQKSQVVAKSTYHVKGDVHDDPNKAIFLTLKYCLKAVEGLGSPDGTPYELEFDEDGFVADSCLEELMDSPLSDVLGFYAYKAQNVTPTQIVNPVTNKVLEGVEIIPDNDTLQKK